LNWMRGEDSEITFCVLSVESPFGLTTYHYADCATYSHLLTLFHPYHSILPPHPSNFHSNRANINTIWQSPNMATVSEMGSPQDHERMFSDIIPNTALCAPCMILVWFIHLPISALIGFIKTGPIWPAICSQFSLTHSMWICTGVLMIPEMF